MSFELPPQKKKSKTGKGAKPRFSLGFYKNVEHATETDILSLVDKKYKNKSEADIMYDWFKSIGIQNATSPTNMKRALLYNASLQLGYIKEPEEEKTQSED